jgi:tRNA threonylcarbamoyl adenosine modification protein YeaZ
MRLLCLDTSTAALSVALVADGEVLASVDREVGIRHGELLALAVRSVLGSARPDAVAVGVGPGPFTSLRVGIATAAALADGFGVPAYPACSLDLLAAPSTVVVQDARRKEVYTARYDATGVRIGDPRVLAPAALADEVADIPGLRLVGAGTVLYAALLPPAPDAPTYPAAAGLWGLVPHDGQPGEPLTPLYLRRPDAVPSAGAARASTLQPTAPPA